MAAATPVPVIVQGLGPIGRAILRAAAADPALRVVGAVDIAPNLVGCNVEGQTVRRTLAEARAAARLPSTDAALATVLQATSSDLERVAPQLEEAVDLGLHVVSTCEDLAYPFDRHPAIAARLDARAREAGRTLVGTGINPGFLMDRLPATVAAVSREIRSITVRRVQDPRPRRVPFQQKVGMGLSRAEYDRRAASGGFGHVGLRESGGLLAAALDWRIEAWAETLAPVQPDPGGPVLGTRQTLDGRTADGRRLRLHFEAQSGVAESYDEVVIEGTPPLHLRFVGGVFGDDATIAAVLSAARVIPSAPRGLITVLDLPLRVRPDAAGA